MINITDHIQWPSGPLGREKDIEINSADIQKTTTYLTIMLLVANLANTK